MRSALGVVGPGHLPAQYQQLVAKDRDLSAFGFCRLAQADQGEDLSEDHQSQGAHRHGLMLPA
jgi:hypothetical protein